MCGIVGYLGKEEAPDIILECLRKLEYRGYDSAGIAVWNQNRIDIRKVTGRIQDLSSCLSAKPLQGTLGIGHTRWATHGKPTQINAHPHYGGNHRLALVHNGVIENHGLLRKQLQDTGFVFQSETDSEAIAHLFAGSLDRIDLSTAATGNYEPLRDAIEQTLAQLNGTYGIAAVLQEFPNLMIAARQGSPLVIGITDDGFILASDANAISRYTKQIVYLNDEEIALIDSDDIHIFHRGRGQIQPQVETLSHWESDVELGTYPHYMLKEIFEQPDTMINTMRGRINQSECSAHFGGLNLTAQQLRGIDQIILTGCGTSWHSALIGEYLLEEFVRIPVEVEYASEFRYRNSPILRNTLVIAITQSGETADTLAAMRESKRKGHHTLAICNVVGSTIAKEADGGIYLHAGPEIGVASTKAFTSQVMAFLLLSIYLGRMRHLSFTDGRKMIDALERMPDLMRQTLQLNERTLEIARRYANVSNTLYLGRSYNFPVALEGALKLKEVSYIHAEGYPAAEMKHGPIALVDEHTPSIFIAAQSVLYEKVMSNLLEIKARGGPVIAIATEGDESIHEHADDVIFIPETEEYLQPLLSVIPLQLLAYHIAVQRGCDVDKPRNLAKSVTVE